MITYRQNPPTDDDADICIASLFTINSVSADVAKNVRKL